MVFWLRLQRYVSYVYFLFRRRRINDTKEGFASWALSVISRVLSSNPCFNFLCQGTRYEDLTTQKNSTAWKVRGPEFTGIYPIWWDKHCIFHELKLVFDFFPNLEFRRVTRSLNWSGFRIWSLIGEISNCFLDSYDNVVAVRITLGSQIKSKCLVGSKNRNETHEQHVFRHTVLSLLKANWETEQKWLIIH